MSLKVVGDFMRLSEQDAKLFFKLMWPLQFFVNQKFKILPKITNPEEYAECTTEEKYQVRKALYENKQLIDLFVQQNLYNFSENELAIVSSWSDFISGSFHIERFLKKYTIVISDNLVYGAMGLYQGFDELIHRSHLPLYVNTVLLPFKGIIVYDGLFEPYNVYFGGGIKRKLKEIYMTAKQNGRIIESLESTKQSKIKKKTENKTAKDWSPTLNQLASTAKSLKGSAESPAIYSPAFSLVKSSIEFARLAESDPKDLDILYKQLRKVERALKKSNTVLNRQDTW